MFSNGFDKAGWEDLKEEDYHKGYMALLSQLKVVGDVTEEQFRGIRDDEIAWLSYLSHAPSP